MAGLLNAKPKPPEDEPQDDGGEGEARDTEGDSGGQALYDQVVKNGLKIIYNRDGMPQLLKSLAGNGQPVDGLANTLATVLARLVQSAEQNGTTIPDDVLRAAASELLKHLATLEQDSGGHKFSKEELAGAAKLSMILYQRMYEGSGDAQQQPDGESGEGPPTDEGEDSDAGLHGEMPTGGKEDDGEEPPPMQKRRGLMTY